MVNEQLIYATLGEEGFTQLTRAFYTRMRSDDLIGPMYPDDDWEGSEERLRDFLLFRFGADQRYLIKRGHPGFEAGTCPSRLGPPSGTAGLHSCKLRPMKSSLIEAFEIP